MSETVDAVVIGAGANGLVSGIILADQGWDVVVLEAAGTPGGAVRSGETVGPGFVVDLYSAFYPLGIASPVIRELDLEPYGLEWCHAPHVLAHPTLDGPAVVLDLDIDVTAASLDQFSKGDGDAWRRLYGEWSAIEDPLLKALMRPFPPVKDGLRLISRLGLYGGADFLRRGLLSVRRLAEETFTGAGGGLLLAGNALHSDLTPETAIGGFLGWMLASIGQSQGWPVPAGGAQAMVDAMVRRLEAAGGSLRCGARVDAIDVVGGRATGVALADGTTINARRAVVADVVAPKLYRQLLAGTDLPDRVDHELDRYQTGSATFKINWALSGPVPWADPSISRAGTIHLAESLDELTFTAAELSAGQVPSKPFVLVGQMTTSDPRRSPPGTESLWAYTSVPQAVRSDAGGEGITGRWSPDDVEKFVRRMEDRIERFAPGFRSRIQARHVQSPVDMEASDANLILGDKSLGTAQIHQQLIWRPTTGLARPETFVDGLYLGSASAHPGGGVHGACGANAARAALLHQRVGRVRAVGQAGAGRARSLGGAGASRARALARSGVDRIR